MKWNLEPIVLSILAADARTRNSDTLLTSLVWYRISPESFITDKDGKFFVSITDVIHKLPMENTVKRIRAMIQNERGIFLPTDPAVKTKRESSGKDRETFNAWKNDALI